MFETEHMKERMILVGVDTGSPEAAERSLDELEDLAEWQLPASPIVWLERSSSSPEPASSSPPPPVAAPPEPKNEPEDAARALPSPPHSVMDIDINMDVDVDADEDAEMGAHANVDANVDVAVSVRAHQKRAPTHGRLLG